MPAFAVGPFVRHGYIDGTRYALPSVLRTVEILYGLDPLNIYDAAATPMYDAFGTQPDTTPYEALPATIPIVANLGTFDPKSVSFELDGPASNRIPAQEWASIRGPASLCDHEAYVRHFGTPQLARSEGDADR